MNEPRVVDAFREHGAGSLDDDRWRSIHEHFHATLDLDPGARSAYLDEVGRADASLQTEIESLLAAAEVPGPFDDLLDRFAASDPAEEIPSRIGAYRPVRLLGRGGMGTVWLAERADGAFTQRVALKVLPAGTRSDAHSRFLAERQILAKLQHPNIARLLDGGTTADGLPYLILEYVEGEPLIEYCDRVQMPVEARLRLFLDVCAAVSWAHSNLIVHRDLKPAHVLVEHSNPDVEPRVKLLDFGIAKLLEDDSAPVTHADLRMLTPDYAAPEQVRGSAITTATDVYQLGGLLYELLAGRRPHRLSARTFHEIEREICQRAPPSPSRILSDTSRDDESSSAHTISAARSTTPKRLARTLTGDLDTIIMHAMAAEPERRYASVDALAADVRHYLGGLPVHARPDSVGYRLAKFVGRNRAPVVASAVIAALLVGLIASTSIKSRRIEAQRNVAEETVRFLTDLLEGLEPAQAQGDAVDPRQILDRARDRVTTGMDDQPLLQARLFDVLARVYHMRGFFDDAEPLMRNALALRQQHLGQRHVDVASSQATLANLLSESERFAEAEPLLESAIETLRLRLGPEHARVAALEIDQALNLRAHGNLADADRLLVRAIATLRRQRDASVDLATALVYLGKVRLERGDLSAADPLIREALDIRIGRFGRYHPMVANATDGLGELFEAGGQLASAEQAYRDALAIRRVVFPANHADVGVSLENVGIVLEKQGRNAEAEATLDSAIAILQPVFGDDHSLVTTARTHRDRAITVQALPVTSSNRTPADPASHR